MIWPILRQSGRWTSNKGQESIKHAPPATATCCNRSQNNNFYLRQISEEFKLFRLNLPYFAIFYSNILCFNWLQVLVQKHSSHNLTRHIRVGYKILYVKVNSIYENIVLVLNLFYYPVIILLYCFCSWLHFSWNVIYVRNIESRCETFYFFMNNHKHTQIYLSAQDKRKLLKCLSRLIYSTKRRLPEAIVPASSKFLLNL